MPNHATLDIDKQKEKLKEDLETWFHKFREHAGKEAKELHEQVALLSAIRKDLYEELNQLQHVAAIIGAAEKLQEVHREITGWKWHPRQTSSKGFGDLTGYANETILLQAEITTSLKPGGKIGQRIRGALEKLSRMDGTFKYYVVTSKEMHQRASGKKESYTTIEFLLLS